MNTKVIIFAVLAGFLPFSTVYARMADQTTPVVEPPQGRLPVRAVGEKSPHRFLYDPSLYIEGEWILPGPDVIRGYYPKLALEDEVDGYATVDCPISKDGSVSGCVAAEESPRGYGFGAATVDLVRNHLRVDPASVSGGIKPGARMEYSHKWSFTTP